MLKVDNSGDGDCMYYAYAISLMYVLRARNNKEVTKRIFDKLELTLEQKKQLEQLLSSESSAEFTRSAIANTIEPSLGMAIRKFAADSTKVEFKRNPQDSSLFTATKYALDGCLKQTPLEKRSQLAHYIMPSRDTLGNLSQAEIFNVPGIKQIINDYVASITDQIILEFETQMKQRADANKTDAHKTIVLESIIREKTVDFFLQNNDTNLDLYIQHLKTPQVWGTEETLLTLHRAIQGEQLERQPNGSVECSYQDSIPLHIYENGNAPSYQRSIPEMILDNRSNVHWISHIPDTVFGVKNTLSEEDKPAQKCQIVLGVYQNSIVPMFSLQNQDLVDKLIQKGFNILTKGDEEMAVIDLGHAFGVENDGLEKFFNFVYEINQTPEAPYHFNISETTKRGLVDFEDFLSQKEKDALTLAFALKEFPHASEKIPLSSPPPTSSGFSAGSSDGERFLDPADKPRDVVVSEPRDVLVSEGKTKCQHTAETPSTLKRKKISERTYIIQKIDSILIDLENKMRTIDTHTCKEADVASNNLLIALTDLKETYFPDLSESEVISICDENLKAQNFIDACKDEIKKAQPILERDLSWGPYLKNLIKQLISAVLFVVSFGQYKGSFKYAKSDLTVQVEEAESRLSDLTPKQL